MLKNESHMFSIYASIYVQCLHKCWISITNRPLLLFKTWHFELLGSVGQWWCQQTKSTALKEHLSVIRKNGFCFCLFVVVVVVLLLLFFWGGWLLLFLQKVPDFLIWPDFQIKMSKPEKKERKKAKKKKVKNFQIKMIPDLIKLIPDTNENI